jgi:hypothetical protein
MEESKNIENHAEYPELTIKYQKTLSYQIKIVPFRILTLKAPKVVFILNTYYVLRK